VPSDTGLDGDPAEQVHAGDGKQRPLVPRSSFQCQVKRNVFSRKEEMSSGSNKDLSHKTPNI
jgi:hypothetical protein